MADEKASITLDKVIGTLFNDSLDNDPLLDLDPYNRNILSSIIGGSYVSGESTIIFSGPPKLSMAIKHKKLLYGLDHVGSINFNQVRINIPVSEFGSKTERLVSGKTRVQATLDKLTTSKEDVKYALYKWMVDTSIAQGNFNMIFSESPGHNAGDVSANIEERDTLKEYKHFPILASEIFDIPFGLFVVFLDKFNKIIYSMYVENCKISNSSLGISANPYTAEGVSLSVGRLRPALNLLAKAKTKTPYVLKAPFNPAPAPKSTNTNNGIKIQT